MQKILFATLTYAGVPALNTLMMISSLRRFGGNFADSPVWVLIPDNHNTLSKEITESLHRLRAKIIPFNVELEIQKFPFAVKVLAASIVEEIARDQTKLLAWLDLDSLIVNEPGEFILPQGKVFGYRPVHHKLIGPSWDEPLHPFWKLVNKYCHVTEKQDFPIVTNVGENIRPYFNAGCFVLRPEKGLLNQWWKVFNSCYPLPEFVAYYDTDQIYAIFMHQAIFTRTILATIAQDEMQALSHKINYPLHLHNKIPANLRPHSIDDLVSVRYEAIFDEPNWPKNYPILKPLFAWLESQDRVQHPRQTN